MLLKRPNEELLRTKAWVKCPEKYDTFQNDKKKQTAQKPY